MQKRKDFIWKMGGQQGEGIESCGEIMATILAKEGYSLYSQRLFASRIKGGHTTFACVVALSKTENGTALFTRMQVVEDVTSKTLQQVVDKAAAPGEMCIRDSAYTVWFQALSKTRRHAP